MTRRPGKQTVLRRPQRSIVKILGKRPSRIGQEVWDVELECGHQVLYSAPYRPPRLSSLMDCCLCYEAEQKTRRGR
jgi:hypothetical protein